MPKVWMLSLFSVFPPNNLENLITFTQILGPWSTKIYWNSWFQFSSVQFSLSVVSDSLRPHESQHARPPCPSQTPRVHSDPRLSSHWCHPAISSSVVPFSSCPQSLPASESFPMSQLFAWGGQSTGVSASARSIQIGANGIISFFFDNHITLYII